jgi:hypothetical protein
MSGSPLRARLAAEDPDNEIPDKFEQIPHQAEHRPIRDFTLGGYNLR